MKPTQVCVCVCVCGYVDVSLHFHLVIELSFYLSFSNTHTHTQVECARGSLNQIPPHATFSGDIRLTPFYDIKDVKTKVER